MDFEQTSSGLLDNSQVDGVIGLGRSKPFRNGALTSYSRAPSFVETLVENNLISQEVFSLNLNHVELLDDDTFLLRENVVHFGEPQ